jgi:UDP-N-acetylglucosamine pyrophosphorylase
VDESGKIVLKNEANIYLSPRGNGMIFAEMKEKNLLSHLQNQGIKYVFFGPINNILLKIANPTALGCLIK